MTASARARARGRNLTAVCVSIGVIACGDSSVHRAADAGRFLEARRIGETVDREWRSYLGDAAVSHYSKLRQIDRSNVDRLELAWSYESGDASEKGASEIQCNPLIVKGVLYGTSPSLRVFALNASTGEELWSFRAAAKANRALPNPNRGVSYWEGEADGDGDERILFTIGHSLYALNAQNGKPIASFGDGGRVDLREGLVPRAKDGVTVIATTPGAIFDDLLVLGSRVSELGDAIPGDVRAFDVRTGRVVWTFRTIPAPGEIGADTWPSGAREHFGGANAWAGFSVDHERGMVFVPTGSASFDFFGGDRPGDNLFANSLIALDAKTGERRWHFQTVRHDVWDRDLPSPPNLVTVLHDGARVPAVAQVTKTGHVFVFHRETGAPLFPIEEVAVVGGGVAGEALAKTQPVPTRPPAFARQGFTRAEVTDRSTEARDAVSKRLDSLDGGALYVAPSVRGAAHLPGTDGGAEWGGAAWDSSTGLLYVNANDVPYLLQVVELPREEQQAVTELLHGGYVMACAGCHGADRRGDGQAVPSLIDLGARTGPIEAYEVVRNGRGRMPGFGHILKWYEAAALVGWLYLTTPEETAATTTERAPHHDGVDTLPRYLHAGYQKLLDPDGLPATRPPWGTLTAIDLDHGELAWQIPLGDYPATREAGHRGLGAESYGGPIVTAGGLLFIAATPDAMFRAFDAATGELLWETELPAAGFATPATYSAGGRQFVVIAAGGGKLRQPSGDRYVAFALPAAR